MTQRSGCTAPFADQGEAANDPESSSVGVGCSLVDDGEGVRVEDHQGKEVANEVFSQARLAAELM